MALPQVEDVSDFHCVTTWSRLDNHWKGVRFRTLAELVVPKDDAQHILCTGYDFLPGSFIPYTVNVPLARAIEDDVLLVHTWEGKPLPREHGGPVRMITPKLYAWKGAKWIRKIEFLAEDKKGSGKSAATRTPPSPGSTIATATERMADGASGAATCGSVRPMLATLEDAPLQSEGLVYEPKYDGIRALVEIDSGQPRAGAHLVAARQREDRAISRPRRRPHPLREKTERPGRARRRDRRARRARASPPVSAAAEPHSPDRIEQPVGRRTRRVHRVRHPARSRRGPSAAAADRAASAARARLSQPGLADPAHRATSSPGDARELFQHALDHGWEGLIAKDAHSVYHTGKRTRDWRKLKIVHEQEFVVGGWTDSRTAGRPFGALLLGYYEDGGLKYAGHTGSGFNQRELERVIRLLKPLEIAASPFTTRPRTNERPHWTKPSLVAQAEIHGVDRRRPAPPSDLSRHEGRCETGDGDDGKRKSRRSRDEVAESPKSRTRVESPRAKRSADFRSAESLQSRHSISSTRSSAGRTRGRCGCPTGRRSRSATCARCSGRS